MPKSIWRFQDLCFLFVAAPFSTVTFSILLRSIFSCLLKTSLLLIFLASLTFSLGMPSSFGLGLTFEILSRLPMHELWYHSTHTSQEGHGTLCFISAAQLAVDEAMVLFHYLCYNRTLACNFINVFSSGACQCTYVGHLDPDSTLEWLSGKFYI